MGKSGSCNNLKTACSFLTKLATWIDSTVEIMHILLLCLPNINFGYFGNLKLPLVYNGKMRILQYLQKFMFFFLMKLATWVDSKVENMHIVLNLSAQYKLWLLWQLEGYHWVIYNERM